MNNVGLKISAILEKKHVGFLTSIIIGISFLCIVYQDAFFSPNSYLYRYEGDGMKNYYSVLWQVKNEPSFLKLSGMSYPYGENCLMDDSMPLLSKVLKGLAIIIPMTTNYTIGIINFLILISLVIGSSFLYLIFRQFKLPSILSALSANGICILSSQVLRLYPFGHWALSFTCFFPMAWYLLIRYYSEPKLKWSVLIGLVILFWTFTHAYLGLIILMFTSLTHIFKSILNCKFQYKNIRHYLALIFQIVLPTAIILCFIKLTDTHPDRIKSNFDLGHATMFESLFLPVSSPLKCIYAPFFDVSQSHQNLWAKESLNYIGLSSTLAMLCFLLLSLYFIIVKRGKTITQYVPLMMGLYLISAIGALLFSMGIPLKYVSKSILLAIPFLKEFLALGRFSWPFFYVISVMSIVLFYRLLYKHNVSKFVLYTLVLLYYIEGLPSHLYAAKNIVRYKNAFSVDHISKENKILTEINKVNFQAILALPSFFRCNLPFGACHSDSSINNALITSYHSGLPILSTYLPRPSVSESMNIYKQLMAYPYRVNIPELISNGKNILVVIQHSDTSILNENEKEIMARSTPYLKTKKYSMYSLSIDSLLHSHSLEKVHQKSFLEIKPFLKVKNEVHLLDTSIFFVYKNFDSTYTEIRYHGNGAFKGLKTQFNIINTNSTRNMDTSKEYEVSFSYYNHIWDQTFNTFTIEEKADNGEILQYLYYSPLETSLIDGWWYNFRQKFKVKSNNSKLTFFFNGQDYFENWFVIDDFMIRRLDTDLYLKYQENGKETIFKNNQKIIVSDLK